MGDHRGKHRTTVKEIDLNDGKIKLYINIHVYNENNVKNNNANQNENSVTATVKNQSGEEEAAVSERVREKKRSTQKSVEHNSARLTNLYDKSKKQSRSKRR